MSYNFSYTTNVPVDPVPDAPAFDFGASATPPPAIDPALFTASAASSPAHVLFIDRLVKRYRLTAQQKSDLTNIYQVASKGADPLSQPDIKARLLALACQYGSERRLMEMFQSLSNSQSGGGDVGPLLKELYIRLEDTWVVTQEQKANVRMLCQEQIHVPSRKNFKSLNLDVMEVIQEKPAAYRLENIIGRQNRETQLAAHVKAISSNVRNLFRQELQASLTPGKKLCTVDKFVTNQAAKHHLSKAGSQAQLVQSVLLRRFARENFDLLEGAEESEELQAGEVASTANNHSEPPAKKRKQKPGSSRGRVADGQDFWSRVDDWFKEKEEAWGEDYNSEQWSSFITESTKDDNNYIRLRKSVIRGKGKTKPQDTAVDSSSEDAVGSGAGNSASAGEVEDGWDESLDLDI